MKNYFLLIKIKFSTIAVGRVFKLKPLFKYQSAQTIILETRKKLEEERSKQLEEKAL